MRGLFGTLAAGARGLEAKGVTFDDRFLEFFAGAASKSGVAVNVDTALKVTTVLACARVLAEGIAQVPFRLYRENGRSKLPASDHPLHDVIRSSPNEWMTSFDFRETLMYHAVLNGNGCAYIGRIGNEVRELIPLTGHVEIEQDRDYGLTYTVSDKDGVIARLPRTSVFHLRGPSWNGYSGLNILKLAREAVGLAIATEESHARFHANSARPAGILSISETLSPEARDRIKKQAQEQAGLLHAGKTMVLDKGAEWKSMAMSGVDAQHLETRRFQIEEICRAFRVFPQMVGYSDKTATFASAEAFFQAHEKHTLAPWAERWGQVVKRDLIGKERGLFAKIDLRGLVRGDFKTRTEGYARSLGAGGHQPWQTVNEVRELEDLDPIEGGDVLPPPPGARPTNEA